MEDEQAGAGQGESGIVGGAEAGSANPPVEQPASGDGQDGQQAQQAETPVDYAALFADPKVEEAAADTNAAVDPNASASAVPAAFQEALGISEYVRDPAQLTIAVRLADELMKVQAGEMPVGNLLEAFRQRDQAGFARMVTESLTPYLEAITGKKLMDPAAVQAGGGEPKTPEQQRIDALEQRYAAEQEQRQQQAYAEHVRKADTITQQKIAEVTKGTFLEGREAWVLPRLAPYLGMPVRQAMQRVLAGDTTVVERAVKAMENDLVPMARKYGQLTIAESRKLKTALPAGPGNPRTQSTGEPDLEHMTRDQRVAWLQSQN